MSGRDDETLGNPVEDIIPLSWSPDPPSPSKGGVPMAELIHVSKVKIIKDKGPVRRAYIEAFPEPVRYGVHGGIKKFYGVEPEEELPTTLDHIIAAVAG